MTLYDDVQAALMRASLHKLQDPDTLSAQDLKAINDVLKQAHARMSKSKMPGESGRLASDDALEDFLPPFTETDGTH